MTANEDSLWNRSEQEMPKQQQSATSRLRACRPDFRAICSSMMITHAKDASSASFSCSNVDSGRFSSRWIFCNACIAHTRLSAAYSDSPSSTRRNSAWRISSGTSGRPSWSCARAIPYLCYGQLSSSPDEVFFLRQHYEMKIRQHRSRLNAT